jgi:membrane-bound metal-dependent hydrolase YbcI (DUF457 family)
LSPVSAAGAVIALAVILAADLIHFGHGGRSLLATGPLDEVAHLATGCLVVGALCRRSPRSLVIAVLVASVAIDLDHLPAVLGADWLTRGTPRPYTHSLTTIVIVSALGPLWPARRSVCLGVLIGLAWHFWRDMAEPNSGVALLWPLTDRSFSVPYGVYAASMVALAILTARRAYGERRALR